MTLNVLRMVVVEGGVGEQKIVRYRAQQYLLTWHHDHHCDQGLAIVVVERIPDGMMLLIIVMLQSHLGVLGAGSSGMAVVVD